MDKLPIDFYKQVFAHSPEAIVFLDKKGILLHVNNRLFDWLGYKPEEIIGKNLFDLPFLSAPGKAVVMAKFAQRMLGKKIEPYEVGFSHKNGQKIIGRINGSLIHGDTNDKEIVGDLVIISEVTKESDLKAELDTKSKFLEVVLANLPIGIAVNTISDGKVIYMNKAY